MAKLPDTSAFGARPTPQPAGGVISARMTSGQEEAVGQGIQQAGAGISRGADVLEAAFRVEKDKADRLRTEEALNALREQQLELTYNETDGFLTKRGSEAVNGDIYKTYNARLKEKARALEQQLGNPEQRELFRQRSAIVGLQFDENLLRHVAGERKVYQQQTFDGTVAVEVRAAAAQPNDMAVVDTSVLRVMSAANTLADERGIPKEGPGAEPRTAMVNAAVGKVHNAVLGQLLATEDYTGAKAYFDKVKDSGAVDPNTAKMVTRAVEEGGQKQLANGYNSLFLQTRDDMAGLRQLEKVVTNDKTLDENRKNIILNRILTRQDTLQRSQQAAYDRQVRKLGNEINGINETTMAGYDVPAENLLAAYNAAKGTELEGEALRAVRLAQTTSQFRRLTPMQREAEIGKVEATIRADPTKGDRRFVSALKQINENINKDVEANPFGFAVAQGVVPDAPINFENPTESVEALHERFRVGRGMQQYYRAPYKPLQPQEVRAIKQGLDKLDPLKKSAWLASLATATGKSPEGKAGYRAIMAQLAEDDPATASAGYIAAQGAPDVAQRILNGQAILNPPKQADGKPGTSLLPMPSQTQLRKDFDVEAPVSAYGGNAKARNIDYEAARAIYADLISKSSIKDTSQIDGTLWSQAIREATGGIDSVNGSQTILPRGMPKNEFETGARARLQDMERNQLLPKNVTADRLWRLPMEPISVGIYAIREGNGYMVDREGRRLEINFNVPAEVVEQAPRPRRGTLKGAIPPWQSEVTP